MEGVHFYGSKFKACLKPKNYLCLELICKSYATSDFDLMFAYDNDRKHGMLYFGKWNDGVAE